jgi:D-alanyl-lipoteichoic acid acyltransferase DltB (MBOAT superfamily)
MGLSLEVIAICVGLACAYPLLSSAWRAWLLLAASVVFAYALQPALPIRFTDFALPTAALVLTVAGWWTTRPPEQPFTRQDALALALIVALALLMSAFRFIDAAYRLTPSRPPEPLHVALALLIAGSIGVLAPHRLRLPALLALLVGLFVLLNSDALAGELSRLWRGWTGQEVTLASAFDWRWLGFSYLAFRLIHTLRDHQSGLLPTLGLRDYALYALFFPSWTAGPIDRAERFAGDVAALPALPRWEAARFAEGGGRIASGLFKKFVIADALAVSASLTSVNAVQAESTLWLWGLLYGYALRLFFDFSGYTDIAIGIGILFGIRLPENFAAPYLKTDITRFWQSWHKSLGNWARFYVFSPVSRALLKRKLASTNAASSLPLRAAEMRLSPVFAAHMATMITIGLWHGVALPFFVWGVWHGAGLYLHKTWSDRTRAWYRGHTPRQRRLWTAFAWLLTFHFVVLGWVWFALPDIGLAGQTFVRLFGMGW